WRKRPSLLSSSSSPKSLPSSPSSFTSFPASPLSQNFTQSSMEEAVESRSSHQKMGPKHAFLHQDRLSVQPQQKKKPKSSSFAS
ncbi:unnamed protein product, partial [Brassica napus]